MSSSVWRNHNGTQTPKAIIFLIGLNSLIFLNHAFKSINGTQRSKNMVLVPEDFINSPLSESHTLITSMFSHADITHLLFNMYALYLFGVPVEDSFGWLNFMLLYFGSGIGSNIMYSLTHKEDSIPLVGGSGAISGVMAAYFLEFADTKNMTTWLLFQLLGAFLATQSNISYSSHLWGFLFGAIIWGVLPSKSSTSL